MVGGKKQLERILQDAQPHYVFEKITPLQKDELIVPNGWEYVGYIVDYVHKKHMLFYAKDNRFVAKVKLSPQLIRPTGYKGQTDVRGFYNMEKPRKPGSIELEPGIYLVQL